MVPLTLPSSVPPKSSSTPAKEALQARIEDLLFGFVAPMFRPAPAMRRQTTKHIVQSSMYPINELADEYFYNVTEEDKKAVHVQIKEAGVVVAGSVVYLAPNVPPKFFPGRIRIPDQSRKRERENSGSLRTGCRQFRSWLSRSRT